MSARVWFAREAQFTADPKIQMLGHEHGPAGPLVVEEIFALAKLADDAGRATILYAQLAGRAFTTAAKAKQIVTRAGELGIVTIGDANAKGCSIDLPRWSRWQVKDATAAERQSRKRHGQSHAESHGAQRDPGVTVTPPTVDIDSEGSGGASARLPIDPSAIATDPRLIATVEILRTAPRLHFDPELAGVANVLAAYPNVDHAQAAHIAVSNVADPNYHTTDAAKALRYAIADLDRQKPRTRKPVAAAPAKKKSWSGALRPLVDHDTEAA